jgi:hypothetical protein
MFLEVHKIATGVLGRPFVVVTEYGVNTLLRFIHMISLANGLRVSRVAGVEDSYAGKVRQNN